MGYKYNKRCAKSKESTPFCSYCVAFRPQSLVFSRGEDKQNADYKGEFIISIVNDFFFYIVDFL